MSDPLPYARSGTQPHLSKNRISKVLEKFGVEQLNFMENFKLGDIRLSFVYNDIPVCIPVNYKKLGELYSGGKKWDDLPDRKKQAAKGAAYSAVEDYLKSMLVMHQLGIMSLEEVFMPNLVRGDGLRLAEIVHQDLPKFLEGKLLTQ